MSILQEDILYDWVSESDLEEVLRLEKEGNRLIHIAMRRDLLIYQRIGFPPDEAGSAETFRCVQLVYKPTLSHKCSQDFVVLMQGIFSWVHTYRAHAN
jgi:hypothetical protein